MSIDRSYPYTPLYSKEQGICKELQVGEPYVTAGRRCRMLVPDVLFFGGLLFPFSPDVAKSVTVVKSVAE